MTEKLTKLIEIAAAIRERDLAVLAAKQVRRKGLALARKELTAQSQSEFESMTADPVYRKSFELPRQAWRGSKIRALTQIEANISAEIEMQKKVLQKSMGRARVLEQLAADALEAKRKKLNR